MVAACTFFFWHASKHAPYPGLRLFARFAFYFVVGMVALMILAFVIPLLLWLFVPGMRTP